jgi:hypothetical protein
MSEIEYADEVGNPDSPDIPFPDKNLSVVTQQEFGAPATGFSDDEEVDLEPVPGEPDPTE